MDFFTLHSEHIGMIITIVLGFIGIATFLYKVLGWVIKINTELKSSHDCITRLEHRINGLLGSKGFKESAGVL